MKLFLIAVCVLSVTLVSGSIMDDSYEDFEKQLVEEYHQMILNGGTPVSPGEFQVLFYQFQKDWDTRLRERKSEMEMEALQNMDDLSQNAMIRLSNKMVQFFNDSQQRKLVQAKDLETFYKRSLDNQYSPPGPVDSRLKHPGKPLNKNEDCKCRFRGASRIVNGQITKPNEIPWQVSLQSPYGSHFCGGTIISPEYILTAAHCINHETPRTVKVRVGAHSLEEADPANTYNVINIISGDFIETELKRPGDIAILRLDRPIRFIPGMVEPGCLNFEEQSYTNDLLASGWGATSNTVTDLRTGKTHQGEISTVLKKAHFHEDREECSDFFVCIASNNEGDSTCQGDSGGPLHYTQNGRTAVQGVLSFGSSAPIKEGDTHSVTCIGTSVYSRLSYYKEWVESIVGKNYCH